MTILDELTDEYDHAMALVNLLADRATGGSPESADFDALRRYALGQEVWAPLLPRWLRSSRSLGQFWSFIQGKFSTYRERTSFLQEEFRPLLEWLESGQVLPAADDIEAGLQAFSSDEVSRSWRSMTRRVGDDPEGAITASRNLLETVLKHILDDLGIAYDHDKIELPELYKAVQKELGLAPEQHQEAIFKQILGGCSGCREWTRSRTQPTRRRARQRSAPDSTRSSTRSIGSEPGRSDGVVPDRDPLCKQADLTRTCTRRSAPRPAGEVGVRHLGK